MKDEEINDELMLPPKEPDEYCNGRNKPHTKYCRKPAGWGTDHVGEGRCTLHGGSSLKGKDHPNYIDGRHSKYTKLPGYLSDTFKKVLEDRELIDYHEDVALITAIINNELGKLESRAESDYWFKILDDNYKKLVFVSSNENVDTGVLQNAVENMGEAIYNLQSEREAEKEIIEMISQKTRVSDSATRRDIALGGMVKMERVVYFAEQILDIIKEHVTDTRLQAKISLEVHKLLKGK